MFLGSRVSACWIRRLSRFFFHIGFPPPGGGVQLGGYGPWALGRFPDSPIALLGGVKSFLSVPFAIDRGASSQSVLISGYLHPKTLPPANWESPLLSVPVGIFYRWLSLLKVSFRSGMSVVFPGWFTLFLFPYPHFSLFSFPFTLPLRL